MDIVINCSIEFDLKKTPSTEQTYEHSHLNAPVNQILQNILRNEILPSVYEHDTFLHLKF